MSVASSPSRLIREGEILPRLILSGSDGPRHVPAPGGKALLLIFAHPGECEDCAIYLSELSEVVGDLQDWGTNLLWVVPGDEVAEVRPLPVLGDEDDAGRRRLGVGADDAAVILADRWGEVMEAATFGPDHRLPTPRQLVESAKIVDISCGECNVPGDEWRLDDA